MLITAKASFAQSVPVDYTLGPEGQKAKDDATGNEKIGYFLETQFKPYFTKCAGQQMKNKDGNPLTSIPASIIQAGIPVWDWVMPPTDYSTANGFSAVVNTDTLAKASLPSAVTLTNRLPFDALQDPSTMVPIGITGVAYSANCTAILAAALSVDSNISFAFAKLSSMVNADYSSTDSGELGMLMGQFDSPFRAIYSGAVGGDDGSVFGHFLLWDWYRNRYFGSAAMTNEKLATLSWYKGISMYRVSKLSRSTDGKIDVKGSASYLGFVNGSGSLDAQYKSFGLLNVNSYSMAVLVPKDAAHPTYEFNWLDTPGTVAGWLNKKAIAKYVSQGVKPTLHKGTEIHQLQQVLGIPAGLCSTGLWSPNPQTVAGVGAVRVYNKDYKDGTSDGTLPSCTFDIAYTPDDQLFSGTDLKSVSLPFTLKTAIVGVTVEVPAQTISFQTSNLPALGGITAAPYAFDPPKHQAGGSLLTWKVVLNVEQDQAGAAQIDLSKNPSLMHNFTITGCRSVPGARNPVISQPSFNGNKELEVTINEFIQSAASFAPDAQDNVTCGISGTLQFQFAGGDFVVLSLPDSVSLVYPNPGSQGFKPGTLQKLSQ
jgi:hypothetical protein